MAAPGGSSFLRLVRSVDVKREKKNFRKLFKQSAKFVGNVAKYACYIHVFTEYVCEVTLCVGPSMMPTLNEFGDIVLTESFSRRTNRLQKGDVVVATSPRNPNAAVCKRIVGMPGDRVCTNMGDRGPKKFDTVPKGRVWLQGDNLDNSTDSRLYGPVPIGLVKARAFVRVWPPHESCWLGRDFDFGDWPVEPPLPPPPTPPPPPPTVTVTTETTLASTTPVEAATEVDALAQQLPPTQGLTGAAGVTPVPDGTAACDVGSAAVA